MNEGSPLFLVSGHAFRIEAGQAAGDHDVRVPGNPIRGQPLSNSVLRRKEADLREPPASLVEMMGMDTDS